MSAFTNKAGLLSLLLITVGAVSISNLSDGRAYEDLRYSIATQMREQLEAKLLPFLQTNSNQTLKDDDIFVMLDVELGNQQQTPLAAGFLSAIHVQIDLRYKPSTPDLDLVTEKFVYQYFKALMPIHASLTQFPRPVVDVKVRIVESSYSIMSEFRDGLVKLTIALFILCLIFLLRYWPSLDNPVVRHKHASPRHSAVTPTTEPIPFPWNSTGDVVLSERRRIHPTQAFLDYQERHLSLRVDPVQGSWYLHALPLLPQQNLQHTFEAMPFDEAVTLLKTVDRRYFANVADRLELHPAIKRSLGFSAEFSVN